MKYGQQKGKGKNTSAKVATAVKKPWHSSEHWVCTLQDFWVGFGSERLNVRGRNSWGNICLGAVSWESKQSRLPVGCGAQPWEAVQKRCLLYLSSSSMWSGRMLAEKGGTWRLCCSYAGSRPEPQPCATGARGG